LSNENYISSGIIEQYVLGLCTDQEQQEIDILRKKDVLLNEAIVNFEIELEEKMMRHSFLPGVATDDKILQALQSLQEPTLAPVLPIESPAKKVVKFSFAKIAAAAAILLLCVSAFFNYTQYKQNTAQATLLASKNYAANTLPLSNYNILKDPSITPVAMMGVAEHPICRCTMFWDKSTGKAYIMIHHLVTSGASKDYQLWATVNGKQVSVGIINDEIRDKFVEVSGVPAHANEFAIILENAGGDKVPGSDVYVRGKI
jgi:hypothetical protein